MRPVNGSASVHVLNGEETDIKQALAKGNATFTLNKGEWLTVTDASGKFTYGDAPSNVVNDTQHASALNLRTTVSLNFSNIPGGDVLGNKNPNAYPQHGFVTVTDNLTDDAWIARAGPGGEGGNPVFGSIKAQVAPNVPGSTRDYGSQVNYSRIVYATNNPPADILKSVQQFVANVNQSQISYNLFTRNSNSFALQVVQIITGTRPQINVWAPGSQTTL